MYRATGNSVYLDYLVNLVGMFPKKGLDWSTVGDYGNIALLALILSILFIRLHSAM